MYQGNSMMCVFTSCECGTSLVLGGFKLPSSHLAFGCLLFSSLTMHLAMHNSPTLQSVGDLISHYYVSQKVSFSRSFYGTGIAYPESLFLEGLPASSVVIMSYFLLLSAQEQHPYHSVSKDCHDRRISLC